MKSTGAVLNFSKNLIEKGDRSSSQSLPKQRSLNATSITPELSKLLSAIAPFIPFLPKWTHFYTKARTFYKA
jgi:hypothetical protein